LNGGMQDSFRTASGGRLVEPTLTLEKTDYVNRCRLLSARTGE
jgi:hypothetical protein